MHYTPTAKLLHWLVAGMVVVQVRLAKLADLAVDERPPFLEVNN